MEQKDYKLYDKIVNDCLLTLYIGARYNNNIITLKNFNRKDENCLCIYEILNMARSIFNLDTYIVMSFWDYLLFSIKFKCKKTMKRKKFEQKSDLNCTDFATQINEDNGREILKEIYKEYYKRGK